MPEIKAVIDTNIFIRALLGSPGEEIKQLLHLIKTKAKIIGQTKNIHACRDRSDDIILEAAVSANASIVVTNDKDLLVLNPFRKISIIEPHQFLELLINS